MSQQEKFPQRVTECFQMGGLKRSFYENGSKEFNNTQECDRGREYISIQERNAIMRVVAEALDFYGDASNYIMNVQVNENEEYYEGIPVADDMGKKARALKAKLEEMGVKV